MRRLRIIVSGERAEAFAFGFHVIEVRFFGRVDREGLALSPPLITRKTDNGLAALRRGDSKAYASYFSDDCIITGDNGALAKPKQIAEALSPRIRGG